MDPIEDQPITLKIPDFVDVFVWRKAIERFEPTGKIEGCYDSGGVHPQLVVALVLEVFYGRLLYGAVHPLDLTVGASMVRVGKSVFDVARLAHHVETHLTRLGGVSVARLPGKLDAVVAQDRVDAVRYRFRQVFKEHRCSADPVRSGINGCRTYRKSSSGRSVAPKWDERRLLRFGQGRRGSGL